MARKAKWDNKGTVDGIVEFELSSWKYFHDFVHQLMLDYSHYVWRGQRDANWALESSLDRLLKSHHATPDPSMAESHLHSFKLAARGRRGPTPPEIKDENEWWALGQHHGLATPLLDWTESAFVALYFAFEKANKPKSGKRAVWALAGNLDDQNASIIEKHEMAKSKGKPPILDFVRPHQNENARLVSQSGLFTKTPFGQTVEGWIGNTFKGETEKSPLLKLVIPDEGRIECLQTLNKMNINHITLFPDLFGAGQHCNTKLQIRNY